MELPYYPVKWDLDLEFVSFCVTNVVHPHMFRYMNMRTQKRLGPKDCSWELVKQVQFLEG